MELVLEHFSAKWWKSKKVENFHWSYSY